MLIDTVAAVYEWEADWLSSPYTRDARVPVGMVRACMPAPGNVSADVYAAWVGVLGRAVAAATAFNLGRAEEQKQRDYEAAKSRKEIAERRREQERRNRAAVEAKYDALARVRTGRKS